MLASFQKWIELYQGDPLRQDAFSRAARVTDLLNQVTPVDDVSSIPADSVLREFIGGSCYEY